MRTSKKNFQIITAKTGQPTVRLFDKEGKVRAVHSIYDPESEAKKMVSSCSYQNNSLIVVLGLGLGYHVRELIKSFPQCRIIVVEADPHIHETASSLGLLSDITDKAEILVGLSLKDVISIITSRQIENKMASIEMFRLMPLYLMYRSYYEPIYNQFQASRKGILKKALGYKKFKDEKMRIMFFDFGYFLRAEILCAIKKLGHSVIAVSGEVNENAEDYIERVLFIISRYKPDFVLSVNHLGFDEDGVLASVLDSVEMPVSVWYVDSPTTLIQAYDKNIKDNTVLFLWDKSYIKRMQEIGFKHVFYLPLATDISNFKPLRLSNSKLNRYQSDVSFVGNSLVESYNKKLRKAGIENEVLIKNLANQLLESRQPFWELLEKNKEILSRTSRMNKKTVMDFEVSVYWLSSMQYRQKILKSLSKYNPVIYGDSGWDRVLKKGYTLKGKANYYTELPLIYNATVINLNITNFQMPHGVNQRIFDVPACKGFLLTDAQPALYELFDVGREMIVYHNPDELSELIDFYLKNDSERRRIAERGYERVIREHTYVHRIKKLIEKMKKLFG